VPRRRYERVRPQARGLPPRRPAPWPLEQTAVPKGVFATLGADGATPPWVGLTDDMPALADVVKFSLDAVMAVPNLICASARSPRCACSERSVAPNRSWPST
jgi:hypothetical protein